MRISDWSSDVCSSDLNVPLHGGRTVERDRWIWKLHRRGHGIMPTDRGLDLNKPDRQRIAEVGGFRELEGYLHLTTDTLVAFYIVLLIQTAANAGPLRQIKRDCLVPHPLERHRVIDRKSTRLNSSH